MHAPSSILAELMNYFPHFLDTLLIELKGLTHTSWKLRHLLFTCSCQVNVLYICELIFAGVTFLANKNHMTEHSPWLIISTF